MFPSTLTCLAGEVLRLEDAKGPTCKYGTSQAPELLPAAIKNPLLDILIVIRPATHDRKLDDGGLNNLLDLVALCRVARMIR